MSAVARAVAGREALEAIKDAHAAVRERAIRDFESSKAGDDAARLEAWATLRALAAIEAELRRPIDNLAILEASTRSTS